MRLLLNSRSYFSQRFTRFLNVHLDNTILVPNQKPRFSCPFRLWPERFFMAQFLELFISLKTVLSIFIRRATVFNIFVNWNELSKAWFNCYIKEVGSETFLSTDFFTSLRKEILCCRDDNILFHRESSASLPNKCQCCRILVLTTANTNSKYRKKTNYSTKLSQYCCSSNSFPFLSALLYLYKVATLSASPRTWNESLYFHSIKWFP